MDRRQFLRVASLTALTSQLSMGGKASAIAAQPADYTIRIGTAIIEVGPQRFLSMTGYNGQFPGPLLRFKEGRHTLIDIYNDTDTPEQLHWHGQCVPDTVDGAAEERTPWIPAHGMRREILIPGPSGFRFYHTHVRAGSNLALGQYGGEVGPVYIEPAHEPGPYDREVFLTLKEFEPFFSQGGDMPLDFLSPSAADPQLRAQGETAMRASLARGMKKGFEVGYRTFTINGRQLGFGEPIRVKRGERVLFHVLNGSATEIRSLALPGHRFKVVALDGNPVPHPAEVPVLWIGTAERVSAVVEMNEPGIWVLGDLNDNDRRHGMGIVVEYAGSKGRPVWREPAAARWDYRLFSDPARQAPLPDHIIEMLFTKDLAHQIPHRMTDLSRLTPVFDPANQSVGQSKPPIASLQQNRPAVGACMVLVKFGDDRPARQIREQNTLSCAIVIHAKAFVVWGNTCGKAFLARSRPLCFLNS